MAKTKAELHADAVTYNSLLDKAKAAADNGMYRDALTFAVASFDSIDGMMRYAERFEEAEFASVETIDLVLRLAPLLLDLKTLDDLEELLRTRKRIDKSATDDLAARLTHARERTWDNHRLWTLLEEQGEFRQDELRKTLGGNQDHWRGVAEAWERMGLISRLKVGMSYQLSLTTRMGEVITGKCPRCGSNERAPKAMLLEPLSCPSCKEESYFVLLGP